MCGHRLRYGLALGCLLASTLLNYGVPLVGSVTIDFAVGGREPGPGASAPMRWLLGLLGGGDHLG
jgi:ATP-binding cassette subfamily B protein